MGPRSSGLLELGAAQVADRDQQRVANLGVGIERLEPVPAAFGDGEGEIGVGQVGCLAAFGELVESSIVFDRVNLIFKEISLSSEPKESIFIRSSLKRFSVLKGQKGVNLQRLRSLYPGRRIFMNQDPTLPDDLIRVSNEKGNHWDIQKNIRS